MSPTGEITRLLAAVKGGDPRANESLFAMIYTELHSLAQRHMRNERFDHTLQPTALVHETYLRLMHQGVGQFQDRRHLFATAATVMRRVLVDHARHRAAAKRGSPKQRVELHEAMACAAPRFDELLIVDEALNRLAEWDAEQAQLVEMIYFGGLTENEAAALLGISLRTAKRHWRAARVWLQMQLRGGA